MSSEGTPLEDFFVTGGTMRPSSPSYVKRSADDELFERVIASDYCYILTARQMGKSSLMVRTARHLHTAGVKTAIVDLTQIGADLTRDQWYLGILTRLKSQLELSTSVESWWKAREHLNPVQRFTDFLRYVLLAQVREPVAIFIDEIDYTLSLSWSDPFFAAIRAAYNNRTVDSEYKRLTFVLLGVATPNDLIQDPNSTPFNIGHHLDLREFTYEDATLLRKGLEGALSESGGLVFDRIYEWTSGQPYMTQKLCAEAVIVGQNNWIEEDVDDLVEEHFLSKKAQSEPNLQFIREYVQRNPDKTKLMQLYKNVYTGKQIDEDKKSIIQNKLQVVGLLGAYGKRLEVRNKIYRHVFNEEWIDFHLPSNRPGKKVLIPAGFTVIILVILILFTNNGFFNSLLFGAPTETPTPAIALKTEEAPTPTTVNTPTFTVMPNPTIQEIIITSTMATVTSTSFMPTPTNTLMPTLTGTPIPTVIPTSTPIPSAFANQRAIIFMAPDTRTRELGHVETNESVEVLGRSAGRFGRVENKPGLYIRTESGKEGFVVALFFDWPGNIDDLPILQPKMAEVLFFSHVYGEPDPNSEEIEEVFTGTLIEVLGRSGNQWLFIRTENGSEGFLESNRVDWRGDFDSLEEQN